VSASTAPRRVTPAAHLVLPYRTIAENRAAWLAARRWRDGVGYCIGSSDVPPILKVQYTGPARRVWLEKRGTLPPHDNEKMYWGRRKESMIAEEWARRNRSVIRNVGLIANTGLPWAQCTLDRMVTECPLDRTVRQRCALEVKNRGAFGTSRRWHAEVPDDILAQGAWQLIVTGYDHIHVAALIGGDDYRQAVVRWDDELADYVRTEVVQWREQYLVAEVEPPFEPDKAAAHLELDALMHPDRAGQREIGLDEIGDVIDLAALRIKANAAVREKNRAQALLAEHARGARDVTFGDRLAYSYEPSAYDRVDLAKLAEEYPAAYAACVENRTKWTLKIAPDYKPSTTEEGPTDADRD
jgi:putative phage-type endonuclease